MSFCCCCCDAVSTSAPLASDVTYDSTPRASELKPFDRDSNGDRDTLAEDDRDQDNRRATPAEDSRQGSGRATLTEGGRSTSVEGERFYSVCEPPPEADEFTTSRNQEYIQKASDSIEALWQRCHAKGWKLEEDVKSDVTVKVSSRRGGIKGKMWMAQADFPFPAETVIRCIRHCQSWPSWNESVETYGVLLQNITSTDGSKTQDSIVTDITYTRAKEAAGGIISPRDFIDVRGLGVRSLGTKGFARSKAVAFLSGGISVAYDGPLPGGTGSNGECTRGENGITGWVVKPNKAAAGQCTVAYILDSDIKGWIPDRVIDLSMSSIMAGTVHSLAQRLESGPPPPSFEELGVSAEAISEQLALLRLPSARSVSSV